MMDAVLNMVCSVCILEVELELFNLKRMENPGIRKSLAIIKWKASHMLKQIPLNELTYMPCISIQYKT